MAERNARGRADEREEVRTPLGSSTEFKTFEAEFKSRGLTSIPAISFWVAGLRDPDELYHMSDGEIRARVFNVGERRLRFIRALFPYRGKGEESEGDGRLDTREMAQAAT
jgi:hypothetical protein